MLDPARLEGYLRRLGQTRAEPSPQGLAALARAHAAAIPFENIDAFLGRRVSLEPAAVFAKLVESGRGGWCFEQNLLLGEALRALGFEVTDLAARVLWGRGLDAVTPRTHRTLLVRVDGTEWLADVGFGGQSISGALRFDSAEEQQVGHDTYRLAREGAERLLSVRIRGEWLPMYRFDLQPQLPVDFEAANFQLCLDPASHFTQALMLSLATKDGRHVMRGRELAFHSPDGGTARRTLQDAGEVIGALRGVFGLQVDAGTEQALRAKA